MSVHERKELVKLLVDSLEVEQSTPNEPSEHWGKSLVRLLAGLGPIDMVNPEIEDPVEWVAAQRLKDADRLKPYWDGEK